jgi:phosphate starvation-inducible PhoH-like protein
MSSTLTLNFDSARTLHGLYVGDESNLTRIEETFKVKLVSREGWVKVEGPAVKVTAVQSLFHQLEKAQVNGVRIRQQEFNFIFNAIINGEGEQLEDLWRFKVIPSGKRGAIFPKSFHQKEYLQSVENFDLVFGLGDAGTGKTYLAIAMAVAALKEGKVNRLILTRPAVEAGEALGFLPGDLKEKLYPYLRPMYDALHDMLDTEEINRYMEKGIIEIAPLAYMRGRTLSDAFIVLDEAQNTTSEQMMMFLTRIGMYSKCVITGDPSQVDLPLHKKSGLVEAIEVLKYVDKIAFIRFDENDVVRHPLVADIISAYKKNRKKEEKHAALNSKKSNRV